MSHFYGIVRGSARTQATRQGSPSSGLRTIAASWQGAISVELGISDAGRDWATVTIGPWHDRGRTDIKVIYYGPINPAQELAPAKTPRRSRAPR